MSIMRIVASLLLFFALESCCAMEINEELLVAQAQEAGGCKRKTISWKKDVEWQSLSGTHGGWDPLKEPANHQPRYIGKFDFDAYVDDEDHLAPYDNETDNKWSLDACKGGRGIIALAVLIGMVYTSYW